MPIITIISVVSALLELAKQASELGHDVGPIISKAGAILTKGDTATQEDIDALIALSDEWSARLQAPLLPE